MTDTGEPRVAYATTGTTLHASPARPEAAGHDTTTLCGTPGYLGAGLFRTAAATGTRRRVCPTCAVAVAAADRITPDDDPDLDAAMREQLTHDPEEGGPRDPAIGPHPRFAEMDARRAARLAPRRHRPLVSTDSVRVDAPDEVTGPIVFTLTRHGVDVLARQLGADPAVIAAAAERTGWKVES